MKEGAGLRTGPKNSYHDKVFEEEVNNLINITKEQYEKFVVSLSILRYPYPFACKGRSTKMP